MKGLFALALILLFIPLSIAKGEESAMIMTNGHARLEFSKAGEVTSFSLDETVFAQGKGLPGVILLYSENGSMWDASAWDELSPDGMHLQETGAGIEISYPSFGGKKVSAVLSIGVDEDGFSFNVSIDNTDSGTVVGIKTLRISSFVEHGGTLYFPDRAGQKMESPFKKLLSNMYGFQYPVPLSAQFLTYSTGKQSWSVKVLDPGMNFKKIWLGDVFRSLEVELYCFTEPGQKGQLPTVRLDAYNGDWHLASDSYREWFDTWAHKIVQSPLIREMPTVASVVILARPVDDASLRDVTKDQEHKTYAGALGVMNAQSVLDGFDACQLVGWHGTGHDTDYPLHEVSDPMGGSEGLKLLSSHMKNMGMQVGYYTNSRLGNINSPISDSIEEWKVKPADKMKIREKYGGEWFEILCPAAEGFIRLTEEKARELTSDYHADFIQLDQIGAARSFLCFDQSHGHKTPASAWAEGYPAFIERVTEAGREENPGFWTWCEGAWEGAGQYLDLQQGGFWKFNSYSEYFPELYRYTFPYHPLMGDGFLGGVSMWVGSEKLPGVKLIKDYSGFYLEARYMDDVGLAKPDDSNIVMKWHKADNAAAIVCKNTGSTTATIQLELSAEWMQLPSSYFVQNMSNGKLIETDAGNIYELTLIPGEINGLFVFW